MSESRNLKKQKIPNVADEANKQIGIKKFAHPPITKKLNTKLNKLLAESIVETNVPFSHPTTPSQMRFYKSLNPNFTPACRQTMSDTHIPGLFKDVEKEVIEKLTEGEPARDLTLVFDKGSTKQNVSNMMVIVVKERKPYLGFQVNFGKFFFCFFNSFFHFRFCF